MSLEIEELIKTLNLEPLPVEGGFFRLNYRQQERADSPERGDYSAIYYLLKEDSFSAMHQLPKDEIYHFYLGDPVQMLLLYPDLSGEIITLGQDVWAGEYLQYRVPGGVWQGSCLKQGGRFALMGTTMSPGYREIDFVAGYKEKLICEYPAFKEEIDKLSAF